MSGVGLFVGSISASANSVVISIVLGGQGRRRMSKLEQLRALGQSEIARPVRRQMTLVRVLPW